MCILLRTKIYLVVLLNFPCKFCKKVKLGSTIIFNTEYKGYLSNKRNLGKNKRTLKNIKPYRYEVQK